MDEKQFQEDREERKRQLRQGMIRGEESEEGGSRYHEELRKHQLRRRLIIAAVVLIVILAAVFLLYRKFHKDYQESRVLWTAEQEASSFKGTARFGTGLVKYGRDSVSCYNSTGEVVWLESIQMTNPITQVCGDYLVLADQGGTSIYVFDESGKQGSVTTSAPVARVAIAGQGMVVAILQQEYANYIVFYDKSGRKLDIEIKTLLEGDGYPLDLALSPTGEQLEVSYTYVSEGALNNKIVFYNFDVGRDMLDKIVGGFEYESTLFPRVAYFGENRAVAAGDDRIVFYSLQNQLVPGEITSVIPGSEMESIFYSDKYFAVVTSQEGENPCRISVYDTQGEAAGTISLPGGYEDFSFVGDQILTHRENTLYLLNLDGSVRYQEAFDFSVQNVLYGGSADTFYVIGEEQITRIEIQ